MRRRWGRTFPLARNWPLPKLPPRRWGRIRWNPKPMPIGSSRFKARRIGRPAGGRRPRLKRRHAVLFAVLLILFFILQAFIYFDKELKGPLLFLAQVRIKQMATEAINTAITQEIAQTADADKMIQWKMDRQGHVSGFLIDYKEQMRLASRTIQVVERVLKAKENVPEHIPIGHAMNSPLISAIGPRLAVTFHPVSAVQAEVDTRQTETGINMLLIEVFIRIRTEIAVVIPFDQGPEVLETEVPLSYALVVGNVPMYYYDGQGNPVGSGAGNAPAIALPVPSDNPDAHESAG